MKVLGYILFFLAAYALSMLCLAALDMMRENSTVLCAVTSALGTLLVALISERQS